MFALILIVPLLLAMLAMLALDDARAKYAALAGSLLCIAMLPLMSHGTDTITLFQVGGFSFQIATMLYNINLMLVMIILFIAPLIILYSFGFMDTLSEQRRFYIELIAFEASMLTFAISGNFILLFMAWELLSLTSYLLIGFWHSRERASRAARKAITVILIGDVCMLGSIAIFWSLFSTLAFPAIISSLSSVNQPQLMAAVLLLLVAVFTKSAQIPFQEWLTDAMEGPTPVSAFLHSTTMVKAGVFAVIVLLPIFIATRTTLVITVFAVATAVISTFNALKEKHIKKIIAYSTIQELSLMLIAVSNSAVLAGIYLLFSQSFYKALIFFSAGTMMKSTGKENITDMSGLASSKIVYITTAVAVLSLAGFVPFAGFFSGVGLASSLSANLPLYVILSLISFVTSVYIFRWFFYASRSSKATGQTVNFMLQPRSMTISMVILAVMTVVASALFFSMHGYFNSGLYYNYSLNSLPLSAPLYDSVIFLAIAIAGVAVSYYAYVRLAGSVEGRYSFLSTTGLFNALYLGLAKFAYGVADGISTMDSYVDDYFDHFGFMLTDFSRSARKASSGNINSYALLFAISLLVLIIYVLVVK